MTRKKKTKKARENMLPKKDVAEDVLSHVAEDASDDVILDMAEDVQGRPPFRSRESSHAGRTSAPSRSAGFQTVDSRISSRGIAVQRTLGAAAAPVIDTDVANKAYVDGEGPPPNTQEYVVSNSEDLSANSTDGSIDLMMQFPGDSGFRVSPPRVPFTIHEYGFTHVQTGSNRNVHPTSSLTMKLVAKGRSNSTPVIIDTLIYEASTTTWGTSKTVSLALGAESTYEWEFARASPAPATTMYFNCFMRFSLPAPGQE